ncbi:MAG: GNAT family protein [Nostoc sp.]|uniref:GNAT family N-acetyltransferase n=1 Tax=Nostoc sp. TaxID=1180 RepID=UPI002FEE7B47
MNYFNPSGEHLKKLDFLLVDVGELIMWLERATAQHQRSFKDWGKFDRIETKTCRPIIDGQRITISDKTIIFAFLIDGLEEPVGRFRYFDINPRNRSAEFGYTINPKLRNQGLGTKMLITAIDYLLTTTELNKLYCQTAAFNIGSVKLLEKLGFHRDGILREHHELDGKLWDDYIYSILRSEWEISKFFNN